MGKHEISIKHRYRAEPQFLTINNTSLTTVLDEEHIRHRTLRLNWKRPNKNSYLYGEANRVFGNVTLFPNGLLEQYQIYVFSVEKLWAEAEGVPFDKKDPALPEGSKRWNRRVDAVYENLEDVPIFPNKAEVDESMRTIADQIRNARAKIAQGETPEVTPKELREKGQAQLITSISDGLIARATNVLGHEYGHLAGTNNSVSFLLNQVRTTSGKDIVFGLFLNVVDRVYKDHPEVQNGTFSDILKYTSVFFALKAIVFLGGNILGFKQFVKDTAREEERAEAIGKQLQPKLAGIVSVDQDILRRRLLN